MRGIKYQAAPSSHVRKINSRLGNNILYHVTLAIVTWYPAETIEVRLILSSRWNEQWKPVKKVTIKRECGSQRGYQQVLVLSNLRSPDTGRGGIEKPNDWLGPQNGSGAPPLSAEIDSKKVSFWAGLVADRPMAIYSGLKTKEYLRHEETQVLQASVKKIE